MNKNINCPGYIEPDDIELKDGHGNPIFIIHTTYRKGDKVTLNYKQLDLVQNKIKKGELHPFEGAPFYRGHGLNTPGEKMLKRFNNGDVATVLRERVASGKPLIEFQFDDGFTICQYAKWMKKLKKLRKK